MNAHETDSVAQTESDPRSEGTPASESRVHSGDPFKEWLGHLLRETLFPLLRGVEEALEPLGINAKHYGVLQLLHSNGPSSQIELTRHMPVDRTTMVHLIDDLEQKGLVERGKDPKDRRVNIIHLLPSGVEMVLQAQGKVQESEREFFSCLSPEEQEQLRFLLRRLQRNDVAGHATGAPLPVAE